MKKNTENKIDVCWFDVTNKVIHTKNMQPYESKPKKKLEKH